MILKYFIELKTVVWVAQTKTVFCDTKSFSGGLPETLTRGSRPEKGSECHKTSSWFCFLTPA